MRLSRGDIGIALTERLRERLLELAVRPGEGERARHRPAAGARAKTQTTRKTSP